MPLTTRIAILAVALGVAQTAPAADLTIQLDGVKSAEGHLMIAVFNGPADYLKKPARALGTNAAAGLNTLVLHDLPPGDYAVVAYHDANDNGQLDRNPMGVPIEDFGFSNNPPAPMGPPSWEQVRITVPADGATARIGFR